MILAVTGVFMNNSSAGAQYAKLEGEDDDEDGIELKDKLGMPTKRVVILPFLV
jgi:hypothetical protein